MEPKNTSTFRGHSVQGLHLDLRIQIMPFAALCRIVREASELGYNTIVMEWEASFPFQKHAVISNEYAYTPEEVTKFIKYCECLGLTVIPVQQCFGHVEYILRHNRYANLREDKRDFCQLCPEKAEEALKVFEEIFAEITASHPAPYLHIGGDETYLLGQCLDCQEKVKKEGKSKLYVDYFKQIAAMVTKIGRTPLLWADMLQRHPEAAHEMPKNTIFVDWNYGWPVNRFGDPENFRQTKFRFWGAPALRSGPDNHSLTCWRRHFENLRDYIPYTKTMEFDGLLLTSWSTSGAYGYQWNSPTDVTDLYPIRRVYPLAGFRILLAAFADAARSAVQFEPEEYVVKYAAERFGLGTKDGRKLWTALVLGEKEAMAEDSSTTSLALAKNAVQTLHKLQPKRHVREFEHLQLMAKFRDHHLRFKAIENECNSAKFITKRSNAIVAALKSLSDEAEILHRHFIKLNKSDLYPQELKQEKEYRFGKLKMLRARLERQGRGGNRSRGINKKKTPVSD